MKKLDHPNVLSLLGVCVDTDDEDMLKLILPFMNHGDLRNFLIRSRKGSSNTEQFTTVCPLIMLCKLLKRSFTICEMQLITVQSNCSITTCRILMKLYFGRCAWT